MATLIELQDALQNAHRAGDAAAANKLADAIHQGNYSDAPAAPAQPPATTPEMIRQRIAESTPPWEAAMLAGGKTLQNLYRGAADLGARAMGDEQRVEAIRRQQAAEAPMHEALFQAHPVSTMLGAGGPYVATLPAGGGGLLGTTATAAGLSGLEYQPELAQRGQAAALGGILGAAGYGLGRFGARMLGGRASQLDRASREIAERGHKLGFRLPPGKATGSRTLEQVDASLAAYPTSSAPFLAIKDANQTRLNQVIGRALGLGDDVDRITAFHLDEANRAIGQQFDDALRNQTVRLDDAFLDSLGSVERMFESAWGKSSQAFRSIIDDALEEVAQNRGLISADRYKQLQGMLREMGDTAIKGQKQDSNLGRAIKAVKGALDDAAERSLPDENVKLFRDAQAKWKLYKNLERGSLDSSTGNVSGARLANTLEKQDVAGFRLGRTSSDVYDAVRFAKRFRDQIGDSGTATRQSLVELAKLTGIGGAGGAGAAYYTGMDPDVGLAFGLMAPVLMRGGSAAYASKLAQRGLLPLSMGARQAAGTTAAGMLTGAGNRMGPR